MRHDPVDGAQSAPPRREPARSAARRSRTSRALDRTSSGEWKTRMATDYDAPRKTEEDQSEESIEELKARRHDKNSGQGRRGRGRGRRVLRAARRRPVPRRARRRGQAQAGGRVHLHELLPGAPPQPAGRREEADLPRLRLSALVTPAGLAEHQAPASYVVTGGARGIGRRHRWSASHRGRRPCRGARPDEAPWHLRCRPPPRCSSGDVADAAVAGAAAGAPRRRLRRCAGGSTTRPASRTVTC